MAVSCSPMDCPAVAGQEVVACSGGVESTSDAGLLLARDADRQVCGFGLVPQVGARVVESCRRIMGPLP